MHVAGSKAEKIEPSKRLETKTTGHWTTGVGICLAGFQSFFGPVFPHCGPITLFWNECIFCPIICWKNVICFCILKNLLIKRVPWVSQETLDFRFLNMKGYEDFSIWTFLIIIWPENYEVRVHTMWFEWERSPWSQEFEQFIHSRWHCLESFRWCSTAVGSMSLEIIFKNHAYQQFSWFLLH